MGGHSGSRQVAIHSLLFIPKLQLSVFIGPVGGAGDALRHAYPWIHEQHREHHETVVGESSERLQPERL